MIKFKHPIEIDVAEACGINKKRKEELVEKIELMMTNCASTVSAALQNIHNTEEYTEKEKVWMLYEVGVIYAHMGHDRGYQLYIRTKYEDRIRETGGGQDGSR